MKKQIAVLMAAATAVTTVAPALAHADVNTNSEVAANIVSQVSSALKTTYKNKNANGITLPTGSTLTKDYLNSQYIVLVSVIKPAEPGVKDSKPTLDSSDVVEAAMEKAGFSPLNKSAYAQFNKDYFTVLDANGDKVALNPSQNDAANYYVVDDSTKLQTILEKFENNAVVQIIDKGAINGASYRTTTDKHYVYGKAANEGTQVSLNTALNQIFALSNNGTDLPTFIDKVTVKTFATDPNNGNAIINTNFAKYANGSIDSGVVVNEGKVTNLGKAYLANPTNNVAEIELKLSGGTKITLDANSPVLDFSKAYTAAKDNNQIKLFPNDTDITVDKILGENTQDVLDQIVKFGYVENLNDKSVDVMAIPGDTDVYYNLEQTPEKLELKNIYTRESGYTKEGADFVNSLIDARLGRNNNSFNFRGTLYQLDGTIQFADAKIQPSQNGYTLVLPVNVRNANDIPLKTTLRFEISGASQTDLYDILRDLQGSVNVVAGHFTKLAGSNRYATAIAVSQEQFDIPETADSVVIVGGYAQMDGLAAAPLATAKNAPILLADPHNGLSKDTLNEIKRACRNLQNKTVYIVGGLNSVPAIVEKQLKENFGSVVLREAGTDRNATSLAVARRLFYDGQTNGNVFVVGRDGGADAMGVASVASHIYDGADKLEQRQKQAVAQKDVTIDSSALDSSKPENYEKGAPTRESLSEAVGSNLVLTPNKDANTPITIAGVKYYTNLDKIKKQAEKTNSYNELKKVIDAVNAYDAQHKSKLQDKTEADAKVKEAEKAVNDAIAAVSTNDEDVVKATTANKKAINDLAIDNGEYVKAKTSAPEMNDETLAKLENDAKAGLAEYRKANPKKTLEELKAVLSQVTFVEKAPLSEAQKGYLNDKIDGKDGASYSGQDKAVLDKILSDYKTSHPTVTDKAKLKEAMSTATVDTNKNVNDLQQKYLKTVLDSEIVNETKTTLDTAIKNSKDQKKIDTNVDVLKTRQALKEAKDKAKSVQDEINTLESAYKVNNAKLVDLLSKYNKADIKLLDVERASSSYQLNGRLVSPILVVNKNGMSRVTRDFIQNSLKKAVLPSENGGNLYAYIVGGENSVSTQVRRELAVAVSSSYITRLAGANRYDTNTAVINAFYTNGSNINVINKGYASDQTQPIVIPNQSKILVRGAVFTSGADQYLVDSQTAGSFAAEKNAPIVLTDKALTSGQVDLMKKNGVLYEQRSGIYQVGGVVSADVMKNVVQLLGL